MLRRKGDAAAVVEAIHRPGGTDEEWGRGILEATASILQGVLGVGILVFHHSPDCTTAEERLRVLPPEYDGFVGTAESQLSHTRRALLAQ